jgi:hypothetical protein
MSRFGSFLKSNAIGLIALFMVLGGVAGALPGTSTVDSGDIIDGAVKSIDIRGSAVGPTDLAPSVRPRWARVNASGAVVRQRGVTSVDKAASAGEYNVNFARPVNVCGWTATLNSHNDDGHVGGEISVSRVDNNTLRVSTMNSAGAETDIPDGEGFTVVAHC